MEMEKVIKFEIICSKEDSDFPIILWTYDQDSAKKIWKELKRAGYTVDIWGHSRKKAVSIWGGTL